MGIRSTCNDTFENRVNFADRVIRARRNPTRNFDNCFECSDGDKVIEALVIRARRSPRLAANLPHYIGQPYITAAAIRLGGRS